MRAMRARAARGGRPRARAGRRYGTFPQSNDWGGRLQFRTVNPSSLYGCLAGIFRRRALRDALRDATKLRLRERRKEGLATPDDGELGVERAPVMENHCQHTGSAAPTRRTPSQGGLDYLAVRRTH